MEQEAYCEFPSSDNYLLGVSSLLPCVPCTPLGTPFISTGRIPHQILPQWPKHHP